MNWQSSRSFCPGRGEVCQATAARYTLSASIVPPSPTPEPRPEPPPEPRPTYPTPPANPTPAPPTPPAPAPGRPQPENATGIYR